MTRTNFTYLERLREKYTAQENGCWKWHGALSPSPTGKWPYGVMQYHGRLQMAHRVSYMENKGPIPAGMKLDHLCRNTLCVNPDHLEPVTHQENIRRGYDLRLKQTHCLYGHEISGANLYLKKAKNGRFHHYCRACKATHEKRVYDKKKAALPSGIN